MDPTRSVQLRWLHGQLLQVVDARTRKAFAPCHGAVWSPAINAYRCSSSLRICVDLAGVKRSDIQLTLEEGSRLLIRGIRHHPEPGPEEKRLTVLAMEIDAGPFEREIRLPCNVDASRITAEQAGGMLWIHLPLLP